VERPPKIGSLWGVRDHDAVERVSHIRCALDSRSYRRGQRLGRCNLKINLRACTLLRVKVEPLTSSLRGGNVTSNEGANVLIAAPLNAELFVKVQESIAIGVV